MELEGDWIDLSRLISVRDRIEALRRDEENRERERIRKKRDEGERERVRIQLEEEEKERILEEEAEEAERSLEKARLKDFAVVKYRRSGKKKVTTLEVPKTSTLSDLISSIGGLPPSHSLVCTNLRKTFTPNDMSSTLESLGMCPGCNVVITPPPSPSDGSESLSSRELKKKKKGSHTMQSVGIYSKDDNAKGELIDGGGGTVYEQEVTSDEEEGGEEGGEEGE